MSEPFLGEIRMVGFTFAPRGWLTCDGQLLAISQNAALFSLLGTTYGGDGVQTFALPDLRGRVSIHQGTAPNLSPYVLGQKDGNEAVTLTTPQMPAHVHVTALPVANVTPTTNNPIGNVPAAPADSNLDPINIYAAPTAANGVEAITNAIAGGNLPHTNIQPYLCTMFIIALEGIYPSRP